MKKINIIYIIMLMLWGALFKIYLIPKTIQQFMKIGLLIIVTCYVVKNIKSKEILFNKKVIFWCLAIVISSIWGNIKGYINIDNVFNSVLHAGCIYYIYILIKYCYEKEKINIVLKSLLFILSIYNVISIISIISKGFNSEGAIIYFLGDKFRTSYYLIMWCSVFLCLNSDKIKSNLLLKLIFLIIIIIVIMICNYVKCSTTVVGSLVFFILYLFGSKFRKLICKKNTIIIILFVSAFIIFAFNAILTIKPVEYFITKILNENINLTGRMHIYSNLIKVFKQSPVFGHGYGNYAVGIVSGFGNAQNAIFQLLVDYGFFGFIIFISLFKDAVRESYVNDLNWGMYIYLIVALICASVEISFNYLFYISFIIIYVFNKKEETKRI